MPALFGFLTSPMDWMVVAFIAFLLFGNRLPSVMRSLGQGVTEFKKGVAGINDDEEPQRTNIADQRPPENVVRPSGEAQDIVHPTDESISSKH